MSSITVQQYATAVITVVEKGPGGAPVDNTGDTPLFLVAEKLGASPVLSISGASIVGGGTDGTFVITLSAAQTAALTKAAYVWEMRATSASGTTVRRVGSGAVRVELGIPAT